MSTVACFFHTQLYVAFFRAPSFHNATLAINEEQRQRIENDRYIHDLPLFGFHLFGPVT
jgi:hypothetical protein